MRKFTERILLRSHIYPCDSTCMRGKVFKTTWLAEITVEDKDLS